MFSHMLVLLDGSPLAECVLPHVSAFAQAYGARATLLRVLEPGCRGDQEGPVDPLGWRISHAEAEAYLSEVAERLRTAGTSVETVILEGPPAQRIVEYVRGEAVDLVVIASHGRTGLSDWNVSSVARKVIQLSRVSVIMVRAYEPFTGTLEPARYRRLLVPLDGSQRAESVLPHATALARHQEAELVLAHVVRRPEMPQAAPATPEDLELAERLVHRHLEVAGKYFDDLRPRLAVDFRLQVLVGADVARTLHDLAEEETADLMVLCAHGSSADAMRPYGSVTMSLVEYGSKPVLVVQDIQREDLRAGEAEEAAREHKGRST